jgi:transposase
MPRLLSQDLRERVVAAVDGGMSCRRAAERFGVSAASAIRWRQLALRHGTPAAKPQGGDRRTSRIEDHAAFILDAIEQQPDPTLAELRVMLAERDVSVSIATLWRFSVATESRAKKDRPRDGARSSRRPETSRGMI